MKYSKVIISAMMLFLMVFVGVVLWEFKITGMEPSTLIVAVFGFCGVEGGLLAWIKLCEGKGDNNGND